MTKSLTSTLTTTTSGSMLSSLPDDIWGVIYSYLSNNNIILFNLLLLNKHMTYIIYNYTKMKLFIRNYHINKWDSVCLWLLKFKRLIFLDISSTNCKTLTIKNILDNINSSTTRCLTSISISKCFGINDDVIHNMFGYQNVALCDANIKKQIPFTFFNNLRILIFSNNSFQDGTMKELFDNFPTTLTCLALGGCKRMRNCFNSTILEDEETVKVVCERSNLVIEVTFLGLETQEYIQKLFPYATLMNLETDDVKTLDASLEKMKLEESQMSRALVSCNNSFNSTPLHIACRLGDVERCEWLLSRYGRTDLKDYKGCTPLHRAVESSQLIKLERTMNEVEKEMQELDNGLEETDTKETEIGNNEKEAKCEAEVNLTTMSYHSPVNSAAVFCDESLPCVPYPPVDDLRHGAWCCASSCLLAGADCFVRNQHYETPLYLAALGGNDIILYTMLSFLRNTSKTDTSQPDYLQLDALCSDIKEFSPLQAAILSRSTYCIRLLLLAGCSPNKQNTFGSTAMHLAYRSDDADIIAIIKDAGGRLDIKDNSGDLPSQYSPEARKARKKKKKALNGRRYANRNKTFKQSKK